ncbi:MAG: PQQ-binding-like beta-propeller repeat protein [Magnetococcales bacterium]|nr:PQQ-binding-like beta-propeller repeat protein [Magnetococcales bacterium]
MMMARVLKKRGLGAYSLGLALLFLTGCTTTPTWLGGKSPDEKQSVRFQAPNPGQETGLHSVWKRSLARSPDKHFFHPSRIAVTANAVYVGTFQGSVVSVDRKQGDILWKADAGTSIMGGVAADDDRVYAGTEQGEMVAWARNTGKELWRTRVSTTVDSAPLVTDGKVIFVTLDNHTYALDALTGERVWMHSTPAEALVVMGSSTPTASDGLVYVGYSSGEVFALHSASGGRSWSDNLRVLSGSGELDMMQDVDASIVLSAQMGAKVARRLAFAVNHQGQVVAYLAANGNRLWERRLSAVRQPLWSMGRLFIADMEGNLLAINAEDGVEMWRVRVSDGLLTSPVLYKDRVLVADNQRNLFSVDPASGRIMGMDRVSGPVLSQPVVTEDALFLWTNEGDLYRYE